MVRFGAEKLEINIISGGLKFPWLMNDEWNEHLRLQINLKIKKMPL